MRIVCATSGAGRAEDAWKTLHQKLVSDSADSALPDFLAVHGCVGLMTPDLRQAVCESFDGVALHGGTSSRGVISHDWLRDQSLPCSGAFAIYDPEGNYGTASADLGIDPCAVAAQTTRDALTAAGRPGEAPDMVLLTMAPGFEGPVLEGIRSVVGADTPVMGGSAADNDLSGDWVQFSADGYHRTGLVISALFPSRPLSFGYQAGHAPSGPNGIVTAAKDRRIIAIDGKPAAAVYAGWTRGAVTAPAPDADPLTIFHQASHWPLGRVRGQVRDVPLYALIQPATLHPDGSLDVLMDVKAGDRLWLMKGCAENLVARAGRVARHARAPLKHTQGGLFFYCAGCMMVLADRMDEVAQHISDAMDGAPFLGLFTFGEQSPSETGLAVHGNLMISCAVFG